MPKYPHWTMEPCLHTSDLDRRLRAAAARWLANPAWRAAWEQRLEELRKDPEYAASVGDATVDEALTNGVVAGILLEQGLLQMDIPRGRDAGPLAN